MTEPRISRPQKKLPKPVKKRAFHTLNILAPVDKSREPFYITGVTKDRDKTHWETEKAALSYLLREMVDQQLIIKLAYDVCELYTASGLRGRPAPYNCLIHVLEEWSEPSVPTVHFRLSIPSGVVRAEPPLDQLPHGGIEALTILQLFALIVQKWAFVVEKLEANPDRLKRMGISPRIDPDRFDGGVKTCAFCTRYWEREKGCDGCPISTFTGEPYCKDTPYMWWVQTGSLGAARAMLAFIKELERMYKAQQADQK